MSEYKPCPACPDGSVWNANEPTSKVCPVCAGHAALNLDGTRIDLFDDDEIHKKERGYDDFDEEKRLDDRDRARDQNSAH